MKQLLVFLLLLCAASVSAQDVIVKKDGSTVVCRVVELTGTEITYKKWSDLNGSNYVMERSAASAINYEDGKKVNLSEVENLYQPNNQNDGVQQYNDKALLKIDYAASNPYKKVKALKTLGWIGGIGLTATGAGFIIGAGKSGSGIGSIFIGSGILWTSSFILLANHQKNKIQNELLGISLYQQDFKFSSGSRLSAGIEMLGDGTIGQNTLGLGLRYNF